MNNNLFSGLFFVLSTSFLLFMAHLGRSSSLDSPSPPAAQKQGSSDSSLETKENMGDLFVHQKLISPHFSNLDEKTREITWTFDGDAAQPLSTPLHQEKIKITHPRIAFAPHLSGGKSQIIRRAEAAVGIVHRIIGKEIRGHFDEVRLHVPWTEIPLFTKRVHLVTKDNPLWPEVRRLQSRRSHHAPTASIEKLNWKSEKNPVEVWSQGPLKMNSSDPPARFRSERFHVLLPREKYHLQGPFHMAGNPSHFSTGKRKSPAYFQLHGAGDVHVLRLSPAPSQTDKKKPPPRRYSLKMRDKVDFYYHPQPPSVLINGLHQAPERGFWANLFPYPSPTRLLPFMALQFSCRELDMEFVEKEKTKNPTDQMSQIVRAQARGDVILRDRQRALEIHGDRGTWDGAKSRLVIEGAPRIRIVFGRQKMWAKRAVYTLSPQRLVIEGKVVGHLELDRSDPQQKNLFSKLEKKSKSDKKPSSSSDKREQDLSSFPRRWDFTCEKMDLRWSVPRRLWTIITHGGENPVVLTDGSEDIQIYGRKISFHRLPLLITSSGSADQSAAVVFQGNRIQSQTIHFHLESRRIEFHRQVRGQFVNANRHLWQKWRGLSTKNRKDESLADQLKRRRKEEKTIGQNLPSFIRCQYLEVRLPENRNQAPTLIARGRVAIDNPQFHLKCDELAYEGSGPVMTAVAEEQIHITGPTYQMAAREEVVFLGRSQRVLARHGIEGYFTTQKKKGPPSKPQKSRQKTVNKTTSRGGAFYFRAPQGEVFLTKPAKGLAPGKFKEVHLTGDKVEVWGEELHGRARYIVWQDRDKKLVLTDEVRVRRGRHLILGDRFEINQRSQTFGARGNLSVRYHSGPSKKKKQDKKNSPYPRPLSLEPWVIVGRRLQGKYREVVDDKGEKKTVADFILWGDKKVTMTHRDHFARLHGTRLEWRGKDDRAVLYGGKNSPPGLDLVTEDGRQQVRSREIHLYPSRGLLTLPHPVRGTIHMRDRPLFSQKNDKDKASGPPVPGTFKARTLTLTFLSNKGKAQLLTIGGPFLYTSSQGRVDADRIKWDFTKDEMVFTGRPARLRKGDLFLQDKTIIYRPRRKTLTSIGGKKWRNRQ